METNQNQNENGEQNEMSDFNKNPEEASNSEKKSNTLLFVLLVILFTAIIVGGGVWWLKEKEMKEIEKNQQVQNLKQSKNITQKEEENKQMQSDSNDEDKYINLETYRNDELRITFDYPKRVYSYGDCVDKDGLDNLKVFEDKNIIYLATEKTLVESDWVAKDSLNGSYKNKKCVPTTLDIMKKARNSELRESPYYNILSWRIEVADILNEQELDSYIKNRYNSKCSAEMKPDEIYPDIYQVFPRGEFECDDATTRCSGCFINYVTINKYSPRHKKLINFDIGQAVTFDSPWGHEGIISESIRFIDNDTATADWNTYKNEEYGFEFKYPNFLKNRMDLIGNQSKEAKEYYLINLFADKGGSLAVVILEEKLEPKEIIGPFGLIKDEDLEKINVGGRTSYKYKIGDAGNWGDNVRIPYGNKTIQISFSNCDQCADILGYENSILSSVKITK